MDRTVRTRGVSWRVGRHCHQRARNDAFFQRGPVHRPTLEAAAMPDPSPTRARLLTITEAAELSAPPRHPALWRHLGTGPRSFRLGRRVLYRRDDLHTWIDGKAGAVDAGRIPPRAGPREDSQVDAGAHPAGESVPRSGVLSGPPCPACPSWRPTSCTPGSRRCCPRRRPARAAFSWAGWSARWTRTEFLNLRERARRAEHARKSYFLRLALASAHAPEARPCRRRTGPGEQGVTR